MFSGTRISGCPYLITTIDNWQSTAVWYCLFSLSTAVLSCCRLSHVQWFFFLFNRRGGRTDSKEQQGAKSKEQGARSMERRAKTNNNNKNDDNEKFSSLQLHFDGYNLNSYCHHRYEQMNFLKIRILEVPSSQSIQTRNHITIASTI